MMIQEGDDIKVSVIVATYNQEKYIARTLDSILAQKVDFPIEILIGDDASNDGTSDVVRRYESENPGVIRAFIREENVGASRNAYELVMAARGEYLAFCEGDDYWTDPEKLSVQTGFLDGRPDLIGCSHDCTVVDENGDPSADQNINWVRKREEFTLKDFDGIYLPGQTATIVKRNIFRGSDKDYSYIYKMNPSVSDRTNTLLFLSLGNFGYIDRKMSAYRRQSQGVGSQTDELYRDNPAVILDEILYSEKLEALAEKEWGIKNACGGYYRELYASSLVRYIKNKNDINREALQRASGHIGAGTFHPFVFISGVLRKLKARKG